MSEELETWYIPQQVTPWSSLKVSGVIPVEPPLPHCVGFTPVFDTLESAEDWRDKYGNPKTEIIPVYRTKM